MAASTAPIRAQRHARLHGRPSAPILLLVLAITTGWGPAAAPERALDSLSMAGARAGQAAVADRATHRSAATGQVVAVDDPERSHRPIIQPAPVEQPAKAEKDRAGEHVKASRPAADPPRVAAPKQPTYAGRNRFWIPSLGIDDRVHLFECSRQRPPDNFMYRWGCAGDNNVYIMGHAYSVMKPLHDAFARGRLRVGLVAVYADGAGRVTKYRVTEWRVVDPTESSWAIADQPVPSMTLQTCVGKDGQLRLNVRLVAIS
jgi:hypothetical protein